MDYLVLSQILIYGKTFGTELALEWFFLLVGLLVSLARKLGAEMFVTKSANLRLFRGFFSNFVFQV